ncbi:hypothetical protein EAF04_008060 [Stromatinia cepivora]|nr:hypothetical protein EAF04_008060 [Stromatinia cepivora]
MPTVTINGNEYKIGSSQPSSSQPSSSQPQAWIESRPEPEASKEAEPALSSLNKLAYSSHDLGVEQAAGPQHVLIHTKDDRLDKEQKSKLRLNQLDIQEYVAPHTYICTYSGNNLANIHNLPFIYMAEEYPDSVVIQKDLQDSVARLQKKCQVDIILHTDVTSHSVIRNGIAKAAQISAEDIKGDGGKLTLTVQPEALPAIANLEGVRYIHEAHPPRPMNKVAREIIQGSAIINTKEYKGQGQVIAIADTGFDKGDIENVPPAFSGRVKKLYCLGRDSRSDDPTGHGTHVCGTAVGKMESECYGTFEAPASQAELVMQSCLDSSGREFGGLPHDLADLFTVPYNEQGARIHSNSWNSAPIWNQDRYNGAARSVDEFVWKHPDMVICFAAGNDGKDSTKTGRTDPGSISSEPAAKNCITVGASESLRPAIRWNSTTYNMEPKPKAFTYGEYFPEKFTKTPISSDHMADNPEGMAAFSSRGPTKELRVKPDIVAPGTCILSTRSRNIERPLTHYGISEDDDLMFDSGTSMATPLVASCCAVIRECLMMNGCEAPTAALIKAILINGAVELKGQYQPSEVQCSPNSDSGFGRVNLQNSVVPVVNGKMGGYREATLNDSDDNAHEFLISVPNSRDNSDSANPDTVVGVTLKVTLVYSDAPGAELQNNLNLIVSSGSVEKHGNQGAKQYPKGPKAKDDFDNLNNVEQVVWEGITSGQVTIKVVASGLTTDKQSFACVWQILLGYEMDI